MQTRITILFALGVVSKCITFDTLATVCFALATVIAIPTLIESHFPQQLVTHS